MTNPPLLAASPAYRFSVCICTRNRPDDLRKALDSLATSTYPITEIIVSDDSTDDATRALAAQYSGVTYVAGPHRGLCANRNTAAAHASGTHLLYIDDDVTIGRTFFADVAAALDALDPATRARTIVTGREELRSRLVPPSDLSFLGFQERPYASAADLRTVVINAAVFPIALFAEIGFDENLVYGYDEVDFCTRAVARGYRIVLDDAAFNVHHSSDVNRDTYRTFMDASRLFVTFKRYLFTERRRGAALIYALVASTHLVLRALCTDGPRGAASALKTLRQARIYLAAYRRTHTDKPPRPASPAHSQQPTHSHHDTQR